MALNDFETALAQGEPVELYKVQHGETEAYFYTDAGSSITYDGDVYEPHAIERGKIQSKTKMARSELKVTVPLSSPVADLFRVYPPGRVVNITIRQGHVPEANQPSEWGEGENFPVAFLGRILEGRRDANKCDLTCELVSASMKRPGLRRHYQWPCSLVLFGTRCGADQAAATSIAAVASITGVKVTLAPDWIPSTQTDPGDPAANPPIPPTMTPDNLVTDYIGGLLEWSGALGTERRTILRISGDQLTLDGPPIGLAVAAPVSVVLGCPHTLDGCGRVHSNTVNYGGQPFIPVEANPIGKNNHF